MSRCYIICDKKHTDMVTIVEDIVSNMGYNSIKKNIIIEGSFDEHFNQEVYKANLVIVLITDRNFQLWMEIGYALALAKNIIVINCDSSLNEKLKRIEGIEWFESLIDDFNSDAFKENLKQALIHLANKSVANSSYMLESEKQKRVFDLWNDGCAALDAGNYDQAVLIWKELLSIHPNHYEAIYKFGTTLLHKSLEISDKNSKVKFLRKACRKFEESIKINPKQEYAYNNWAITLKKLAILDEPPNEKLIIEAIEKLKNALSIKPDYCDAIYNMGINLAYLGKISKDKDNARQLLEQAAMKVGEAQCICPYCMDPEYLFSLANYYALLEDENECHSCLEEYGKIGGLPPKDKFTNDPDFASVVDKDWFNRLNWPKR